MYKFDRAIQIWDFKYALKRVEDVAKNNNKYFPAYCVFLADIGKLDILYNVITTNKLLCSESADFKIVRHLFYINKKFAYDPKNKNFFNQLFTASNNNDIVQIKQLLNSYWDAEINADLSAENNMVLNFAFNQLAEADKLDLHLAVLLSHYLFVGKYINHTRKKALLIMLIDYFLYDQRGGQAFYRLGCNNHLHELLSMIYDFSSELGGQLYLKKLVTAILHNNKLKSNFEQSLIFNLSSESLSNFPRQSQLFEELLAKYRIG